MQDIECIFLKLWHNTVINHVQFIFERIEVAFMWRGRKHLEDITLVTHSILDIIEIRQCVEQLLFVDLVFGREASQLIHDLLPHDILIHELKFAQQFVDHSNLRQTYSFEYIFDLEQHSFSLIQSFISFVFLLSDFIFAHIYHDFPLLLQAWCHSHCLFFRQYNCI